ncbi:MAG TPA: tetratricopeptide repeat protein [Bacteroidetes bacterium]|nr:tetratricopeptide repeat protein [Bacteroidota bacterium]
MNNDQIESLREALRLSPDNLPLRLHLARTLMEMGQLDEAEAEFKAVMARKPQHSVARTGLADVHYRKGNYSTAIVILEDLLSQNSHHIGLLLLYCHALLKDGSVDQAQDTYQRILVLDPAFQDEELDARFRQQNYAGSGESDPEEGLYEEDTLHMLERPEINFSDVGGMENVKEEIGMKIIHPLKHPDLYRAYGKKIGGGILLYGPPGCGKTHLARATAGEVEAGFLNIGISEVLDMWIGNSEKNLKEMFEMGRRNTPCVLFFDEVDALGASRSDMRQSAGRHLINQFLSEMDGIDADNEGLLILGATNAPWHLDPAFRRPGRFDRIIFVAPPDKVGRTEILRILLKGKPTDRVDLEAIAAKTAEFSGADLEAVIDLAIEAKLREAFKTGIPSPITTKDLLRAAKSHSPSTKDWFNTARNYALYANDSGLYDDILKYLKLKK